MTTTDQSTELERHLELVAAINALTCESLNEEDEIDLDRLELLVTELKGLEVAQGIVPTKKAAIVRNSNSISIDSAEYYAKMVFFSILRGDMHACLVWQRKAMEEYYQINDTVHRTLDEIPIAESDLDLRVVNGLDRSGIIYWGQLKKVSKSRLMSIPNFGEVTYLKLMAELQRVIRKISEV